MDVRGGAGLVLAAGLLLGLTACQTPGGAAEPHPSALPQVGAVVPVESLAEPQAVETTADCEWVAVVLSTLEEREVCRTW